MSPGPLPAADGRQSPRALEVRRGTARLLAAMGLTTLPEVPLASGRRADLLALSPRAEIWIVEIKSSLADLRADGKWRDYRLHCDRLFFATLPDVPAEAFPAEAGLIVADGFGGMIVREAPVHVLHAATRKETLVRAARLASARLHLIEDPGAVPGQSDLA